jgi:hypothetical protein
VSAQLLASAAVIAAVAGSAVVHGLKRWLRAQGDGVFRVRRVV